MGFLAELDRCVTLRRVPAPIWYHAPGYSVAATCRRWRAARTPLALRSRSLPSASPGQHAQFGPSICGMVAWH